MSKTEYNQKQASQLEEAHTLLTEVYGNEYTRFRSNNDTLNAFIKDETVRQCKSDCKFNLQDINVNINVKKYNYCGSNGVYITLK